MYHTLDGARAYWQLYRHVWQKKDLQFAIFNLGNAATDGKKRTSPTLVEKL
jgi:hypothetical protein